MNLGNLAAADVNGDGIADLITVGTDYDDVPNQVLLVWLGTGDGTFPEAPSQSWFVTSENADPAPGLAVADFNDDGALDIAVTDPKIWYFGADDAGNPRGPGSVIIFLGDASSGQFSEDPLPSIEVGEAPFDIKVCNFNADGNPDLLVTNYFSNTTTVILTSPTMPTHLWEKHSYPVDGFPMFSACGAFAGKAVDDFATSITPWSQQASPPAEAILSVLGGTSDTPDAGRLDVWYNDGSASFKDSRQFPTGQGNGIQLATGDVDGDDILDLLVASTNGDIQILQGSTDGSFKVAALLHQPEEQRAYGLALTDFNGDGLLDVVTANTPPLTPGDLFFAPRGGANVIMNTCWVEVDVSAAQ